MRGLKLMNECVRISRSLSPYVDGELDPGHAVDIEAHVLGCPSCSERVAFMRGLRSSLKQTTHRHMPDSLRQRISAAMITQRTFSRESHQDTGSKLINRKYAFAAAAAAGVAFAIGMVRVTKPAMTTDEAIHRNGSAISVDGVDTLLEELVSLHANPLPPETTNPEELTRFDPLVGVPVRRPAFQPFGASFKGARVHAMRDRRAALLQYTLGGNHRVTVYVFDPRAVPMRASRLRQRLVQENPVYVGKLRGYSIAAAEKSGVGYALASDLSDDESTRLVIAAASSF